MTIKCIDIELASKNFIIDEEIDFEYYRLNFYFFTISFTIWKKIRR